MGALLFHFTCGTFHDQTRSTKWASDCGRIHVTCCLLTAKFAHKFLHILCVQLWLLPGHAVPTTRKLSKLHQVDLAGGPFPRQGRLVRTVCNGGRHPLTLPHTSPTRD